MFAAMLLGLLFDPQGRAVTPPPDVAALRGGAAPGELKVVVAAPVYQPDGAVSVEMATVSSTAPSLVHVYGRRSLCDTATTGAAEPADAGFGWRVATNTVSRSASEVVVSIDWRRAWDRGQKLSNGPSGTVQLTLHAGDRIPLDHIPNTLATGACRAVGMGLEVSLARASAAAPANPSGVVLPLGAVEGGVKVLDAELWLLHTLPTGTLQVQHQTVRLPASGGGFNFAPVKFSTPQGEVGVELTGLIQRYRAPSAGEFLLVSMARVITGGRAPAGGLGGTTPGTLIALPGPAEVLSFEMPGDGAPAPGSRGSAVMSASGGGGGAVRGSGGGGFGGARGPAGAMSAGGSMARALTAVTMLDGHGFSIRVRVTPAPEK